MLSGLDLRGVLNYVEQFNKKNFLFILEEACLEEAWLSGFLLDVDRLLGVGVGCCVCFNSPEEDVLKNVQKLLLESAVAFDFFDHENSSRAELEAALSRGQIIVAQDLMRDKEKVDKLFKKLIWIDAKWPAGLTKEQLSQRAIFLDQQVQLQVGGGASKLLEAKLWCEQAKVPRVHFLTTAAEHSLLEELFSAEGVGLMVYTNPYEEIRPLQHHEIVELLALMGPVISRQTLLPRNYLEIENNIGDYLALVVDQQVLGCVALHSHYAKKSVKQTAPSSVKHIAEIACLFINPAHQNQGYARKLVCEAEHQARERGATTMVALTKTAGKLFTELGYSLESQEYLPESIKERGACDKEFYIKEF